MLKIKHMSQEEQEIKTANQALKKMEKEESKDKNSEGSFKRMMEKIHQTAMRSLQRGVIYGEMRAKFLLGKYGYKTNDCKCKCREVYM